LSYATIIVLVSEMYDCKVLFQKNRFEGLAGYLPKLLFKYLEIQLFHITAIVIMVPEMYVC